MDNRFPRWLRWLSRKLEWMAVPNLGMLIAGIAVMAYFAKAFWGTPFERFIFDPDLILEGEWWRLFSFPLTSGMDHPIWLLFYVLYVYFVLNAVEGVWGPAPLTLFVVMGYLSTAAASFLLHEPVSIWYYILQNIGLAFGVLFPEMEIYFFFVIPLKAKWLAAFMGVVMVLQFILGGFATKVLLVMGLLPFFLFFGPHLFLSARTAWKVRQNRRRLGD